MSKYTVKKVNTEQEVTDLANVSALTFVGLSTENLKDVAKFIKSKGRVNKGEKLAFHIIPGQLMNEIYKLTGDLEYPEGLSLVSITGIDPLHLALPMRQVNRGHLDEIIARDLENKRNN